MFGRSDVAQRDARARVARLPHDAREVDPGTARGREHAGPRRVSAEVLRILAGQLGHVARGRLEPGFTVSMRETTSATLGFGRSDRSDRVGAP